MMESDRLLIAVFANNIMSGTLNQQEIYADAEEIHRLAMKPDWTPCAEGLPTETDKYWVTFFYYGAPFVEKRDYFAHEKRWGQGGNPVAWMHTESTPDPYNPDHIREATKKVSEELTPCKACGCNYVITWEHHCIPPHRFYCQCAKCKQKTSEHENKELAKQEWEKMQEDADG